MLIGNFIVSIPSRFSSTRLPGKPLVEVGGLPMVRRVCLQCLKANPQKVIVCVDDERVSDAIKDLDSVEICMTSKEAKSGTDRIAQMISILNLPSSTPIVNVQGDEPLIEPSHIKQVAQLLEESKADMATLCSPIKNSRDLFDPSSVKVVMNKEGFAMYFSRAPIPYERDNFMHNKPATFTHYHHIGLYAYKAGTVTKFAQMSQTQAESAESLEQLRLLENGMRIAVGVTENPPEAGVDTPEDLIRVNKILASRGE